MDEVITCGVNVAARGSPFLWSPETALQVLAQVRPTRRTRMSPHAVAAPSYRRDPAPRAPR